MKKLLSLILCFLLAGCTAAPEAGEGTFTDDLGRTVTVETPQKVASLLGSFAQVWILAGGTVCAAPEEAWNDLNLDLSEDAVNLGQIHQLNMELRLAIQNITIPW